MAMMADSVSRVLMADDVKLVMTAGGGSDADDDNGCDDENDTVMTVTADVGDIW